MLKSRQRILYYCQSLVGIGHLTASLQIIKALSRDFDVDLIYGGIEYSHFPVLPNFRILQLPPLLFNADGKFYAPDANCSIDEAWQLRQNHIVKFIHFSYQAIIFEFYPFGRRRFKKEVRALIKQVRDQSGDIPLFSQIREIMIPSDSTTEQLILDELITQFHTILVRGDPEVIKLDETFALAPKLGNRLFYGGYIGEPMSSAPVPRKKQILVSQGGGNVGRELLIAAIQTAPLLPTYSFMIATGVGATLGDLQHLQSLVASPNVNIVPFLADFRGHLLTSALSINMGGDNTLLDVIATKTPSLAYPYPGNSEQALRIEKLAEQGWVNAIDEQDLKPLALVDKVNEALSKRFPERSINLNGAVNISNKVREVIQGVSHKYP